MGRDKKFSEQDLWHHTHQLLLSVGYQGFTMSLLAQSIGVSRAAIYKQYPNKEELIIQFMVWQMEKSIENLSNVNFSQSFEQQLEDLLVRMFDMRDLHQILGFASQINDVSLVVKQKKEVLNNMHGGLYIPLQQVIKQGKEEGIIAEDRNDFILLSFIFQLIDMPNHLNMPIESFLKEIKLLILHGISK